MIRGLYIHIPFCKKKCGYCDFYSVTSSPDEDEYRKLLIRELSLWEKYRGEKIDSIFFGGGTPSLFSPGFYARIVEEIGTFFSLTDDAEISIEANPESATARWIKEIGNSGINRLSLGIQSFDDKVLKGLGRIHTGREGYEKAKIAISSEISSVNLDFILGTPFQSRHSFQEDMKKISDLSPDHLSRYGLIIEPGTPFYHAYEQGKLPDLPSDEREREYYHEGRELLRQWGYDHYEISNWAKPGHACRHNLNTWHSGEYFALGPAASGYVDGRRYTNVASLSLWKRNLKQGKRPIGFEEFVDREERQREWFLMRLRLRQGISRKDYEKTFGTHWEERHKMAVEKNLARGRLEEYSKGYRLSDTGLDYCNAVILDFL